MGLNRKSTAPRLYPRKELLVAAIRGDKQDGRLQRFLARADHLGRLESVHLRHADIQQNGGEIVLQTQAQGVGSVLGEHEVLLERFEDRLKGQQVVRIVVDEQELDPSVFFRKRLPRHAQRCPLRHRCHASLALAGWVSPVLAERPDGTPIPAIQVRMTENRYARSTGLAT